METLYIPLGHAIAKANVGLPLDCANRSRNVLAQPGPPNVDRRCVQMGLDVGSVELFDHLVAGATILGDLVDIDPLHQPKADVCVPQAIGGAPIAVAVKLQPFSVENLIELPFMIHRKETVRRFRRITFY